jgi:hypothetical protein
MNFLSAMLLLICHNTLVNSAATWYVYVAHPTSHNNEWSFWTTSIVLIFIQNISETGPN